MTPPKPPRPPTHHGDRNENRARIYTPPLGSPIHDDLAAPHAVKPETTNVTVAPSPELLEVREKRTTGQQLERVLDYARAAEKYRHERELLEAEERKAERKAKLIIGVIVAVGGAIAAIVAAVH